MEFSSTLPDEMARALGDERIEKMDRINRIDENQRT